MENKCPHCGKKDCVPQIVFTYALTYNPGSSNVLCIHCHKPIEVITSVAVTVSYIAKSDNKEYTWALSQMLP